MPSRKTANSKLNSIRGWLLFLVIFLIFIQPLFLWSHSHSLLETLNAITGNKVPQSILALASFVAAIADMVFGLVFGVMLLLKTRKCVRRTLFYFGVKSVVFLSLGAVAYPALGLSGGVMPAGLISGIWLVYLRISKRVKSAFGNS